MLIKISGEALAGDEKLGIDVRVIEYIAQEILSILKLKVQVGLIVGGGNFFRGATLFEKGVISRVNADNMGMVATILNALAMGDIFNSKGIPTKIMSARPMMGIIKEYDHDEADNYLNNGYVVIFSGGTGNPLFTTDSALSLRGIELQADILLKATNVDGIYSSDPIKDINAKKYKKLTYDEALRKELAVMDLGAFCQCRDNNMSLVVFNLHKKGALLNVILGNEEGTIVLRR